MTRTPQRPGPDLSAPIRVVACACTYRRNEPLRRLLTRLAEMGDAAAGRFELGVVVVDDNPNGEAEPVTQEYTGRFSLGIHYRRSGKQNISLGRNLALATGVEIGDVLVMTDDDCLPEPQWIDALLATQAATGADAVSGPMIADVAPDASPWITRQGLFDRELVLADEGAELSIGQTNNCLLRSEWLGKHPDHRFDPEFGRIGGEDMVFFKGAIKLGMRSRFSVDARVHAVEPLAELTLGALVRSRFWWGNSEAVINHHCGDASRPRLALRGLRRLATATAEPVIRLLRGRPPQVRSALVASARAAGVVAGALGYQHNHH